MNTILTRLAADQADTLDCRPRTERIRDLLAVAEAAEDARECRELRLLEEYLAPLLEAGFSGVITDKRGRKLTYRDGKRVAGSKSAPAQKGKGKPKAKAVDHAAVHAKVQKAAAQAKAAVAKHAAKVQAAAGAVKAAKVTLAKATKSGNPKAVRAARDKHYLATQRVAKLKVEGAKLKASAVAHGRLEKLAAAMASQPKPAPAKATTPAPTAADHEQDNGNYQDRRQTGPPPPDQYDETGNWQDRRSITPADYQQTKLPITRPLQQPGPSGPGPGTLGISMSKDELDRREKEAAAPKKQPTTVRKVLKWLIDRGLLEKGEAWKDDMGGMGKPSERKKKKRRRLLEMIEERAGRRSLIFALMEAGFTGTLMDKRGRRIHFRDGKRVSGQTMQTAPGPKPRAAKDAADLHKRAQKAMTWVKGQAAKHDGKVKAHAAKVTAARAALVKAKRGKNEKAIAAAKDKLYLAQQYAGHLQKEGRLLRAMVGAHAKIEERAKAMTAREKGAAPPKVAPVAKAAAGPAAQAKELSDSFPRPLPTEFTTKERDDYVAAVKDWRSRAEQAIDAMPATNLSDFAKGMGLRPDKSAAATRKLLKQYTQERAGSSLRVSMADVPSDSGRMKSPPHSGKSAATPRQAVAEAKSLGVEMVGISTSLVGAANALNATMRKLKDAGHAMPSKVVATADHKSFRENPKAVAAYDPGNGKLYLNPAAPALTDPSHMERVNRKHPTHSTAKSVEDLAVHELAHALHDNSGKGKMRQMNLAHGMSLDVGFDANIAKKVSDYAATQPIEFVAETFTGLMRGESYPPDVMDLYARMGGPEAPVIK